MQTEKMLLFLNSIESFHMPESAKMIRQSLVNGTYCRHGVFIPREVGEILNMKLVTEQNGMGVSVVCDNGMEYRFAAMDEDYSDYPTPKELLQAAIEYLQNHDAAATLNFISDWSVQYYEQKVEGNVI